MMLTTIRSTISTIVMDIFWSAKFVTERLWRMTTAMPVARRDSACRSVRGCCRHSDLRKKPERELCQQQGDNSKAAVRRSFHESEIINYYERVQ